MALKLCFRVRPTCVNLCSDSGKADKAVRVEVRVCLQRGKVAQIEGFLCW